LDKVVPFKIEVIMITDRKFWQLVIVAWFCLSTPLVDALSVNDETYIKSLSKPFVDNGLVDTIDVTVQPPDSIVFWIVPTSGLDDEPFRALLVGIYLFSVLTYQHAEVTSGTLFVYWGNHDGTSTMTAPGIHVDDLWPITDRRNPTELEVLQVAGIIIERAKQEM